MGLLNLPTPNRYLASAALMRWYDAYKRAHPFDGLRFFSRCFPSDRILLASRHWRYSITWSWVVDFRWRNVGAWWKPRAWWWLDRSNSGGQGRVTPWIGFAWQHEMPRAPTDVQQERRFIDGLKALAAGEES